MFLPNWLRPLPRIIQRKRRQYWWSLRAKPASGWHVQQLIKIAATMSLPHQRYCILDSDIVFFRDFDLARFEYPNSIPLLKMPNEVTPQQIRHARWVDTSHQLLGLPQAVPAGVGFHRSHHILGPADRARDGRENRGDHRASIGSRRCAGPAHSPNTCCTAISCRTTRGFAAGIRSAPRTQCVSYWDQPKLGKGELNQLLCARQQRRRGLLGRLLLRHAGANHPRGDRGKRSHPHLSCTVTRQTAGLVA